MKKLLFSLLIDLYILQIILMLPMYFENIMLFIILGIFILLAVVLAFINIGCAVLSAKKMLADENNQRTINRTVFIFKLLAIPFYALNYLLWSLMTGVFLVMPGNVFFLLLAVPLGIGFTYLILLSSSSYSIVLLFVLKKNGKISLKKLILHIILQLVFIFDVIDQIFILKYTKPTKVISEL